MRTGTDWHRSPPNLTSGYHVHCRRKSTVWERRSWIGILLTSEM
jgi:hypothetical protein